MVYFFSSSISNGDNSEADNDNNCNNAENYNITKTL